jgi:hypothetical protein
MRQDFERKTTETAQPYPLKWPEGQPRARARRHSKFKVDVDRARRQLLAELRMLGADHVVISSNQRNASYGADNGPEPKDTGVAVYFAHGKKSLVIACDSYVYLKDNMRAVGVTVAALRTIQRHGATELLERAFTGFAALPPRGGEVRPWYEVLGVSSDATVDAVKAKFRELSKIHHPDLGGDEVTMSRFTDAYRQAMETRR